MKKQARNGDIITVINSINEYQFSINDSKGNLKQSGSLNKEEYPTYAKCIKYLEIAYCGYDSNTL